MEFTDAPIPKTPRRNAAIVMAFILFTASSLVAAEHFDADWLRGVPFLLAIPVGCYFFWPRRCPECHGRLTSHTAMEGNTTAYRWLARCDRCQIDWDTGHRGDTREVD